MSNRQPRIRRAVGAAVLAASLSFGSAIAMSQTATAASPTSVTIKKIATLRLGGAKTQTVKPRVSVGKNVKVTSKKLTVTKAGKAVAKNRSSVKLAKGTYKVTTTVKYKTKSTTKKLVSDGSTAVKMSCTVADVETNNVEGYDVELMFLDCTGDFDGVYKARAGWWADEFMRDLLEPNIWGDSFVSHPNEVLPIIGKRFTATVTPVDADGDPKKLYKTGNKWSSVKTKTLKQTLKVTK